MENADGASRKERKRAGSASSSQSDPENRKRRKKEPRGGGGSGDETGKDDAGELELDGSPNPGPQILKSSRSKKRTGKGKEIDGSSPSASLVVEEVSSRSDKKAKEDVYGMSEKASERNDGENKERPSSDGCGKGKEKPIASSSVLLDEPSRSRRYKRAKEVPLVGNVGNQQEVCDGQKEHGSLSVEGNCENKKLHGSMASTSSKGEMAQEKTQKKKKKSRSNASEALQGQTEGISRNGDGKSGSSRSLLKGGLKSANSHRKGNGKKVAFSDQNTVFPISSDDKHAGNECKLIVGKRYTKEEDQILRDALTKNLKAHGFGWEDGNKIFGRDRDPSLRGFWKEIYIYLPWRTHDSIMLRSENLLLGSRKGNWTQEEIELLKRYREKHGKGTPWKGLSEILNRYRHHIKDAWRRNRLPNESKGYWSQEEYQKLFDLVNMDLRMKAFEKKDVRNLMVRDNISWTAISDVLGTKSHPSCCLKWYKQLQSPMVSQGLWSDCDDYHLIDALSKLDASCAEDVDWDVLVEGRSGDFCRKRWKEMTRHIGEKKERSFMEQVGLLSTRYCKDMLEYRTGDVKEL